MNDPHVVALWYRIEHGDSVDYGKAKPLAHVETSFRVKAEQGRVCFKFKDHYATEDAARKAIDDYVRAWEFDAGLLIGPDSFKLTFDRAEIRDRKPPPPGSGVAVDAGRISVHWRTSTPKVVVGKAHYPSPPSGLRLTPDVQSMYDRFQGYRLDREPLASMAYFCLTVFKQSASLKVAARTYGIQFEVLRKISELSSTRGGQQARKAEGRDRALTDQDSRFLQEAVRAVIRRAAEKAHASGNDLPGISLSDLPPI